MFIASYTDKDTIQQMTGIDMILQSWEMFYKNFSFRPDEKEFPKYYPGDVIDEEKSVKWNREEIKKRMDARTREEKRLRALYNELNSLYEKITINALAKEYGISTKEVSIIWNKAYVDNHSFGMDAIYDEFCELADMYEELRKAANES